MSSLSINFERFISASSQPINVLDRDLRFVFANAPYLEATKKKLSDLIGEYVFDAFPDSEERVTAVLTEFNRALKGETTYLEAQPFEIAQDDGTTATRYWRAAQEPYFDENGDVSFIIQRADDITPQVEAELQNELVARELAHRMKNMMTIVRSVARLTARQATSIDQYSGDFIARLDAMARTYSQLEMGAWNGLPLNKLLEDELSPYADATSNRLSLDGPMVLLSVQSTKDLSLIFHELATNAAKYGAFATPNGRLKVAWHRTPQSVVMTWEEMTDQTISEPTRAGFGSKMIKMIKDINVERNFKPSGLVATLTLSMKALSSQLASDIELKELV